MHYDLHPPPPPPLRRHPFFFSLYLSFFPKLTKIEQMLLAGTRFKSGLRIKKKQKTKQNKNHPPPHTHTHKKKKKNFHNGLKWNEHNYWLKKSMACFIRASMRGLTFQDCVLFQLQNLLRYFASFLFLGLELNHRPSLLLPCFTYVRSQIDLLIFFQYWWMRYSQ